MILSQVEINNVRNIADLALSPHPALNLITGNNGSGKSAILEAFQCLATGHTFRTRRSRELIAHGHDSLRLTALFQDSASQREYRVGSERRRDGTTMFRLNFEDIKSQSEIARLLPVKALSPESHRLMQDGPDERRRFLDWGLFHVKPGFMSFWQQYKRSLSQRNQLLREKAPSADIDVWNAPLLDAALNLQTHRQEAVHALQEALDQRWDAFGQPGTIQLQYRAGWDTSLELADVLLKNLDYHRRMKTTTDGPHRAELVIKSEGHLAKQVLSRGQQKTLVYVLHLSQLDVLSRNETPHPIVLCDDLSSELDNQHTEYLVDQLQSLNSQLFVTGVDLSLLFNRSCEVFHMEHGNAINGL